MMPPILFVDEKKIENNFEYRFTELKSQLFDCEDIIEFIADLDIVHSTDTYTESVTLGSNPYLHAREIIFIHVSQDSPTYNEILYNALKASQPNTLFARFSGQGSLNTSRENLRFQRTEHIYNPIIRGFQNAIRFYKQHHRFEPYILVHGSQAFIKKNEEAEKEFSWLVKNITNLDSLRRFGTNRNFEKIMILANLDANRIKKGKDHVQTIDSPLEYLAVVEKYVRQIRTQTEHDNKFLKELYL